MEHFARLIIRFRVLILLAALGVSAWLGFELRELKPDDDVLQFLPATDPDIQLFRRVNERFGGLDVAIVGLETDDIFTVPRLKQIRELSRRIGGIEGVYDVLSFTEAPDPRPTPFGLSVEPLMDRLPADAAELEALKLRVLANQNAIGNLISKDGRAAMILCFLGGKRPPVHVASDIKQLASSLWSGKQIYYGGAPFIRLHVAGGTQRDLHRLTPVVVIVVTLVTLLLFPKPLGVAMSLAVVGLAVVWALGFIVLRGRDLTIVDSALPTLLVAIGGAYGIHVLGAYFNGKSLTVRERIVEALRAVGGPIIVSVLTTVAGFIGFEFTNVLPMRRFGETAALGVTAAGLLALTVIPAALSFSRKVPGAPRAEWLAGPLGRLGGWAAEHRRAALLTAAVLFIASAVGTLRMAPDSTLKSFFADDSEPDLANRFLERHFGGSVYLQLYFEGDMRSPQV